MGRLPSELEDKRQRLLGAARRGAFESYVRHGRVPDVYSRIAEMASEAKRLNTDVSLDALAANRPIGRPTTHYVWRTAGDAKVRGSHVARNGQIFSWANPPEHGHPGHEPNCRCWPEPYCGDPAVPDALLKLVPERRVNTDPGILWASIDTLTRPDGTLAASVVRMHDGTSIDSTFVGSSVDQLVTLPTRNTVRVRTEDGTQSIHAGGDVPLLQSKWTANGPIVTRTRRRLAFLIDDPLGPDLYFDPLQNELEPDPIFDPNPMGGLLGPDGMGPGAIGAALLLLYLMRQAEPESMGAGKQDIAHVAFRAWTNGEGLDGKTVPVPIAVGSFTEEQARQACPLLPQVQAWTDRAAFQLLLERPDLNGQSAGIALHGLVKAEVDAAKREFPFFYRGVWTELSMDRHGELIRYGAHDSSRLDVIDVRSPEEPTIVCDFEVKTGDARLGAKQRSDYIARLAPRYPGATIYVFKVTPTPPPPK
jgi:SPP1 gp7 family putative phage head morphogenesis protein